MSSDVSLTPSSRKETSNEKRRPDFRPANPTKKQPKRSKGTIVTIAKRKQNQQDAVISPSQQQQPQPPAVTNELKRSVRKPRTKINDNNSNGTSIARNAIDDQEERQTTAAAPGSMALSTFCSKYRVKGVIATVVKETPAPDQMLPEPEEPPVAAGPVVQIINGEIVLQASSMEVPNTRKTVAELEEEFDHVVEEEGHSTVVGASYTSFVDRKKPLHWNVTETKLFYNALRQVGTDFACMEAYFENRSRKQLKRKYQIEISKNSLLVELALNPKSKVAIDLSIFNVDKDSIVITKETPIIHQPTTTTTTTTKTNEPRREESDEDPTMDEVDETEMDDEQPSTPILASTMTLDSIFGDDPLFEDLKELVENTQEEPEEAIPLLVTTLTNNRINKRPKFKARSKKK